MAQIKDHEQAALAFHDPHSMFMEAPIGVFTSTPQGQILSANPYIAQMFGYDTPQDALNAVSHISQLYADPADRAVLVDVLIRQGTIHNYECRLRHKDGNVFWSSINARVIQKEDQETYYVGFITNIDRAKRAEEELRRSECKYRELVDNANSIILRMDTTGNVTYFNEYAQSFFGYKAEEIIGRNVIGTIVPETDMKGDKLRYLMENIGKNPEKYSNNENENMLRCGTKVWIAWTNKAIADAEGNVSEVLCIGRDITEMKNALHALDVSHSRYRAIAEDLPVLLCRFLPGCKLTYVNQAYCQYFQKSIDDLVGKSFLTLIPKSDHKMFLENLSSLTPESPVISHEHQVMTHDGSIRWQRWTERAIFDDKGVLREFQSVGEDITERKRLDAELKVSREKYRAIYYKSPIAIAVLNKNGEISDANPACVGMFGFETGQDMKDYAMLKLFSIKEEKSKRLNMGETITCHQTLDFEQIKNEFKWKTSRIGFISLDVKITPLSIYPAEGFLVQMQDITWDARI